MDVAQIKPIEKVAGATPEYRLEENDQTFPAGMWRLIVTGDTFQIQRATAVDWSTTTVALSIANDGSITGLAAWLIPDDILFKLGTGADEVLLNRSTVLNANTALTGVLIGTPVSPALAANSLIIANQTQDGDILIAVNDGGTSKGLIHIDGSLGEIHIHSADGLNFGSGSDADQDLITVDVTGTPKIYWDESDDCFRSAKAIIGGNMTNIVGDTTANWNTATGTSGESGEDLVTIGANDTNYKLLSLTLDVSACTNGALLTVKMFMQINGVEQKVYSQNYLVNTDPDGLWIVQAAVGIHEAVRVEVESDTSESVAIAYDYSLESM